MTIFVVVCAAIFPVFHVGCIWFAVLPGWLFPSRTRTASGRTSARRWSGMCSRCRPTVPCRCSSGTSASFSTRHAARSLHRGGQCAQGAHLRLLRHGLARFQPPVEQL
jgi:hypothetical protein